MIILKIRAGLISLWSVDSITPSRYHYLTYSQFLTQIGHSEKLLVMRVFIAVLVLIFSLQSWTKADDISDFEIEGISIGDSLLDYFSEEEIEIQILETGIKQIHVYLT